MFKKHYTVSLLHVVFHKDELDCFLLDGQSFPAKIVAVHGRDKSTEHHFANRPAPDSVLLTVQLPVANHTRVLQKKVWASPRDTVEVRPHKLERLPVVFPENPEII
jgi:hypothetical protein